MMVSIIIPARNEPYLTKTINDLLSKAKEEIEIIAVLDGYWPDQFVEDKRVNYLHFSDARGMRNAINSGVAVAKGEYALKTDAHCLFAEGFDTVLKADCQDDWVVVPRRYALDVEKWQIEERRDNKYPIDKMILDSDLHGVPVLEKNKEPIEDLETAQGSCWFMKKSYFHFLELLDEETYGTFWQEFQEIGFKCWLSGGRVVSDTNTWYAHFHKTVGRGYKLPDGEKEKTQEMINKWKTGKVWHKQIHDLQWLLDRFNKGAYDTSVAADNR